MAGIQKKKPWKSPFWQLLLVTAIVFLAVGGWLLKPGSPEEESLEI